MGSCNLYYILIKQFQFFPCFDRVQRCVRYEQLSLLSGGKKVCIYGRINKPSYNLIIRFIQFSETMINGAWPLYLRRVLLLPNLLCLVTARRALLRPQRDVIGHINQRLKNKIQYVFGIISFLCILESNSQTTH